MRDGLTRRIEQPESKDGFAEFTNRWRAAIVILSGDAAGTEHDLQQPHITLGRGPDTDLTFDDEAMSREHAALEFTGTGFRIRDLGSMNGMLLNGGQARVGDLKNGDRFQLGEHVFQYLLERCTRPAKAYVLPDG
ncbi:MAG: FHA domain-containing protein [Myxococcales bacterium]|nr:FHA domain-containing protein [Myxococcales bacterium]